jgi:hypothetical protein
MKLHVCGLSFGGSSVIITVLYLDILQFVDPTLEFALFAQPSRAGHIAAYAAIPDGDRA